MTFIFVGGAGGLMEARRAMRRQQRMLERQMRRRQERRSARRDMQSLRRYLESLSEEELDALSAEDRTEFDCFYLCDTCHRIAESSEEPCPSCASTSWIDLGHNGTAEALRDVEERERSHIPRNFRLSGAAIGAALTGLLLLLVVLLIPSPPEPGEKPTWKLQGESLSEFRDRKASYKSRVQAHQEYEGNVVLVLFIGAVLTLASGIILPRYLVIAARTYGPSDPTRWRHPTLPPPEQARTLSGKVQLLDEEADLLTAPFSEKPCLAYQLSVLFDIEGDARPPEWVLQEVRSLDLEIGEETFSGDQVMLQLVPEPIDSKTELATFLRKRGLFAHDGHFQLFEARVEPHDEVHAQAWDSGGLLIHGSVKKESPG